MQKAMFEFKQSQNIHKCPNSTNRKKELFNAELLTHCMSIVKCAASFHWKGGKNKLAFNSKTLTIIHLYLNHLK